MHLAALTMTLLTAGLGGTPAQQNEDRQPVIVSSGTAVVRLAPDRAYIVLATETLAARPSEAQARNAQAATAVRQRLKELRVPDDAIRTLSYLLNEDFEFVNNRRVSRGFRAVNQIQVRVDEIARVGEIVDGAVEAGAATVSEIRFDVKDRDAAERQALRLAVTDAKARADAMAAGAGVTLGAILRIDEGGQVEPVPRPAPMAAVRVQSAETPVSAGEIEIRAAVTFTAAIK
jgi:uncharacterized protein